MPQYDIKLGVKNEDGTKGNVENISIVGTVRTVMEWITERLGVFDRTVHDIHHLEIIEK